MLVINPASSGLELLVKLIKALVLNLYSSGITFTPEVNRFVVSPFFRILAKASLYDVLW
ncbi:Uncharacterised protein, partial [Mycoplasmopsis synoviae]